MVKRDLMVKRGAGGASFFSSLLSSLELSDTTIYEPYIRALLGTAPHFCSAIVLKLRTVPLGTAPSLRIVRPTGGETDEEGRDIVLGLPDTHRFPHHLAETDELVF